MHTIAHSKRRMPGLCSVLTALAGDPRAGVLCPLAVRAALDGGLSCAQGCGVPGVKHACWGAARAQEALGAAEATQGRGDVANML